MDERVALDANEQLREEIGELREMMREVMRRQQTPRGLRPKPPVPRRRREETTTAESPTRSHRGRASTASTSRGSTTRRAGRGWG